MCKYAFDSFDRHKAISNGEFCHNYFFYCYIRKMWVWSRIYLLGKMLLCRYLQLCYEQWVELKLVSTMSRRTSRRLLSQYFIFSCSRSRCGSGSRSGSGSGSCRGAGVIVGAGVWSDRELQRSRCGSVVVEAGVVVGAGALVGEGAAVAVVE